MADKCVEAYFKSIIPNILFFLGGEATASQIIFFIKNHIEILDNSIVKQMPSASRKNEMTWEQDIRNIVSHSQCAKKSLSYEKYPEGFLLVKDTSGTRARYVFVLADEEHWPPTVDAEMHEREKNG